MPTIEENLMDIELKSQQISFLVIILTFIMTACQPPPETPEPVQGTLVVAEQVEPTSVEVIQVVTPTPDLDSPRTLVVCIGGEPLSLYPFGLERNFDFLVNNAYAEGDWGAYDSNSYAYQPIILEKLPSLDDGDAILTVVTVNEGDTVIDADGTIMVLEEDADPPIMLVPAGGGDPLPYQGGQLQMDQLSATFTMLPDLLWSDGTPMTAADSVYAYNLLADPDTPRSTFSINRTASYEAVDNHTIVWTGLPGFLDPSYATNFFGPAPEHLWDQYTVSELQEAEISSLAPVGWGPYIIDEWVQGEHIILHKNPNYFRAAEGLPKFEQLIIRFVGENVNTSIAAILSGECDLVDTTADLIDQIEQVLELHEAGLIKATFTTGTTWEHIDFGIQHIDYDDGYQSDLDRPDFFSDVRTRQAFAMCMDRQALVDDIMRGQSIVIDSYIPPQHPLYNPDIQHYEFDPAAGSALLEEVGWLDDDGNPETARVAQGVINVPDGTSLELSYITSSQVMRQSVQDILKASLAKCGIVVDLANFNPGDLFAEGPNGILFGRQFDLSQFAWGTGVEPPCDLNLSSLVPGTPGEKWTSIIDGASRQFGLQGWFNQNITGFAKEDYDRACGTALGSLPGQPEYEAAHLEAQRIFGEQLPMVPLFLRIKLAATRPDFCGLIMDPSALNELWNIEEFDYGEGCEE
jgi:peptide/nickel transport system substrate-binding protein